ncbi:MAG: glyoxalase superfamily protein [Propionibacteriaceae bacterium]
MINTPDPGETTGTTSGSGVAGTKDLTGRVVPILRMFDWDKAQEFYLGYLGWTVDWQHRYEESLPRYVQVSSPEGLRIHLSEHHGDGTPGSAMIIEVRDAPALHAALVAKDYPYARPGLDEEPWGRTITVYDPFGNRLTFLETAAD